MKKEVVEYFAGVGGFRLALEKYGWETKWFSQWEPGKKAQWAHDCYEAHWGKCADLSGDTEKTGWDIAEVDKNLVPDHTLLVGGFPCFTADTKIITSCGAVAIVDVHVGDNVILDGKEYPVLQSMKTGTKDVIALTFSDGYKVKCTPEHRFLTENGFVHACEIAISDNVVKDDGSTVKLTERVAAGVYDVYDIEVQEIHRFCLENHIVVHNCQDYSVAHSLRSSDFYDTPESSAPSEKAMSESAIGITGKKGVLWWQLRDTIVAKEPAFCLFENVDRLLKSPAFQRGRDFGIILACLNALGYYAEWRVVNAAEYGAAQRRRRTFIFAARKDLRYVADIVSKAPDAILQAEGFMAKSFPVTEISAVSECNISTDIGYVSDSFKYEFQEAGFVYDGKIYNCSVKEDVVPAKTLGDIMEPAADEHLFISGEKLEKWVYLKGSKKIERIAANGHPYTFSEGAIPFPERLDAPSRTMLTSEGSLNRSTHVVTDRATGQLRILTPIETERLQGFPDDWTHTVGLPGSTTEGKYMPEHMRYFCMGNALVVPMIERMAAVLDPIVEAED